MPPFRSMCPRTESTWVAVQLSSSVAGSSRYTPQVSLRITLRRHEEKNIFFATQLSTDFQSRWYLASICGTENSYSLKVSELKKTIVFKVGRRHRQNLGKTNRARFLGTLARRRRLAARIYFRTSTCHNNSIFKTTI